MGFKPRPGDPRACAGNHDTEMPQRQQQGGGQRPELPTGMGSECGTVEALGLLMSPEPSEQNSQGAQVRQVK